MKRKFFISLALLVFPLINVFGQKIPDSSGSGFGILTDSTYSGYKGKNELGGPTSIEAQLVFENQVKESYFRIPIRVFKPWFETKEKIINKTDLEFGINYTIAYLGASTGITDSSQTSSGGGILDIPLSWSPIGKESGNTGTFSIKFETRHTIGTGVPPMLLGFETGSILLPATKVNSFSFRISEFYYQQTLFKEHLKFALGKLDPTNYFNFYGMINPFTNFFGYGFSSSPTANWPNQGLGTVVSIIPTTKKDIYVMGGVFDVLGDPFNEGDFLNVGNQFFEGNLFKSIEVGYIKSYAERYFKRISLTYWNSDSTNGIDTGQGVSFSSHWYFKEKYIPFFRAGFSNGKGTNTLAEKYVAFGNGFRFKSHDILNIGFNWAKPTGLRDQYSFEIYYRFNLTEHLAITPDLQWVINPSLNESVNNLIYWGIRGRFTL